MNSPAIFRTGRRLKRVVALLAPVVLISIYLTLQTSSGAQTLQCARNLLSNGSFSNGVVVVGNGEFPPSTVPSWTTAFQSPQVSGSAGCGDPGFMVMWGNKVVGEGIRQSVNIQAGRTYRLSACVRWVQQPTNPTLPSYVRFNVRAANWPITYTATGPAAPSIGIIGDPSNTPSVPAPGITSTAWTTITLATWTAPANFNTIVINPENNSTNNNGNEVSWGAIDNLCLQEIAPQPDFVPPNPCQGQAAQFSANAPGATSWSWDFNGDGITDSTQQNATHIFASPGTFPVKLCVPGGSTNCVTKSVTVKPAPPVPTITGPTNAVSGQPATYSVPLSAGISYSWTISNGTISGPTTGTSVNVIWGTMGTGTIAVTATNKGGCSSSRRLMVTNPLPTSDCCHGLEVKSKLSLTSGGLFNLNTMLSPNQPNVVRVTANIISSSLTFSSPSCGTAGPVNSFMTSATPAGTFQSLVLIAGGDEAVWYGPPANLTAQTFPMQIQFPAPPPSNSPCRDFLTFCIKYTITTNQCRSCEVVRCYGPFQRGGPIWNGPKELKEIDTQLTP